MIPEQILFAQKRRDLSTRLAASQYLLDKFLRGCGGDIFLFAGYQPGGNDVSNNPKANCR